MWKGYWLLLEVVVYFQGKQRSTLAKKFHFQGILVSL